MIHLYFTFYLVSLLSGVALITNQNSRHKNSPAFKESLAIYLVLTLFMILGTGSLYITANVVNSPYIMQTFLSGACVMIGSLVYLLPRYNHILFQLDFTQQKQFIFLGLLLICFLIGIAIWYVPTTQYLVVSGIPICILIVVVIYTQQLYFRYYQQVFTSTKPKLISSAMPLISIGLAITEVLFWGSETMTHGVTLSLPLIYLLNNCVMWYFQNELYPAPVAKPKTSDSQFELPDCLTRKEQEVVMAVTSGLSNKQVADKLCISPSTVKNHLSSIFKKMEVTNRVALINRISSPLSE
ncbi:LuxR C-terminal-related transcriptional regulator [uncultured Paraglaciecola sp.]|uniref:response regulator transcription factor n=1 Tax=uncultured Paraglaciecola sp. TaxID=1765024 RepID=UPI0025F9FB03|nr:LuxR C-terminal-related transcriptional regulator [uncultured Paraglaciecola sp.]